MLAAFLFSLGLATLGEPPQPPAEGGAQPHPPFYETSQERTLQGTVTAVEVQSQGPGRMVTLSFLVDTTVWKILVGPEEALTRQGASFAKGDALDILGSPVEGPDGQVFMARQITRSGVTWTFLDASGHPAGPRQSPLKGRTE